MFTRRLIVQSLAAAFAYASEALPAFAKNFDKAAFVAPPSDIGDKDLVSEAQRAATMLFWECGHPVSGMIGDRMGFKPIGAPGGDGNRDVVTGATGFGIIALLGSVDEGWLNRDQVLQRVQQIVSFLKTAETWHGMFPHQMNGTTGKIVPFDGPDDTGGDVVETAFLMMGLLSAREFFDRSTPAEKALRDDINQLWEAVDWTHYVRFQYDREHLFWRLSLELENKLKANPYLGVAHVSAAEATAALWMAAMSPTHRISPELVQDSLDKADQFRNGEEFYGRQMILGPSGGGDLFYMAYIATAFDLKNFRYKEIDFGKHMSNHASINAAYSRQRGYNPVGFALSASDGRPGRGYRPRAIFNDDGTLNPPMAMAYYPVAEKESIRALRYLYDRKEQGLWGRYGPVSAFSDGTRTRKAWKSGTIVTMDILAAAANLAGMRQRPFMNAPELQRLIPCGIQSPYIKEPESQLIASAAPSP